MALRDLFLGAGRVVPLRCLQLSFSRSGGPGGQNVNKVETKVDLRLNLTALESEMDPVLVSRMREKLANRLDAEGRVVVVCDEHRSRARNIATALERLEAMLRLALVRQKKRVKTKPTRGSQRRRLDTKKQRGQIKKWRSGPSDD